METPRKLLVLFAHPAIRRSRVNRRLVEAARGLDGVTVNDLYEAYPDLDIDVEKEQRLLVEHDVVVFQYPFYWYSTPAILKEWQDLVLKHGWAYGHDGHVLEQKLLLNVITTGGSEETYCRQGSNHFTMRELLAPLEQTARLCGMRFLSPFVVHGTHALDDETLERHAKDYRKVMIAFRDRRADLDVAGAASRLNDDLNALMGS